MSAHPLSTPPLPSPLCLAGPPAHPASLCLAGPGRAWGLNQGERMLSALQRQRGFYQHPQKPLLELGICSLWEFLCLRRSSDFCWSHRVPPRAAELGAGPRSRENWDRPVSAPFLHPRARQKHSQKHRGILKDRRIIKYTSQQRLRLSPAMPTTS